MPFYFNASLSGLNANSSALGVIGNNISNANTIGYRSSGITFADVFANSRGARLNGAGTSMQIGNGVRVASIQTNFSQGNFTESGSPLHAAIQGNGFFTVRDANGVQGFTRAGDFTVDRNGYIVAPGGQRVQGFAAVNGVIPNTAPLTDLIVPLGQSLAPQVTSQATLRMNLDAAGATGSIFHATMQVYDTRGAVHTMDLTFTKQANGSYNMTASLDGNAATTNPAAVNFVFDANGNPTSPTSLTIIPDQTQLGGASLPSVAINLRETNPDGTPGAFNITNYARPSAVSSTFQDGYPAGEFSSVAVDTQGIIYSVYTNGQTRAVGQYAIATFNAPEGLNRIGGNLFAETISSGTPTIGAPDSGGRGAIASGMLEQSNVNVTSEFIELIEAQRGFQSNARVINTLNQTFQDLLQII
jgi:flagellar hook protein FlgE